MRTVAFFIVGVLLGLIWAPAPPPAEIIEVVWVQSDPTRYEFEDHIVCYFEKE